MQHLALLTCLLTAVASLAVADVSTIQCPAEAPVIRTVHLEELWRLDPEDPDTPLMGLIQDVAADPGGDLYLVDRQLCQILVYSREGEYQRTIGRQGEGPGEFLRPTEIYLLPDETLSIREGYPAKIEGLERDGTPTTRWSSIGTGYVHRARPLAGGYVLASQDRDHARSTGALSYKTVRIASYDGEGNRMHDFFHDDQKTSFDPPIYDESESFFPQAAWDLTPDNRLVLAPDREQYRLELYRSDGTLDWVIERPMKPHRRSRKDKDEVAENVGYSVNGQNVEVECHIMDTDPMISSLTVTSDGSIAVRTCHTRRLDIEGLIDCYDLHAPDGTLCEQIRIVANPAIAELGSWHDLGDGHMACVHQYGDAASMYWSSMGGGDEDDNDDLNEIMLTVSCWKMVDAAP